MTKKDPKRFVILIEGVEPLTDSVGNVYTFKTSKDAQDFIDYEEIENAEVARRDIDFKDTNKYGKIAEWIISQDVATGIKSEDIKEIADFIFGMNLTPKEIKLVKDELLSRKYFNIKDAKDKKFRDNYYGNVPESILRKSKDFILKRLFRELDEEKAKPLSIDKENNIADIKSKITSRVKEIKNVPNDIHDSKDNCKYIVYLNGEPYYTAHSEDEANRIESEIYSNTDQDFENYYGPYPDVRIKKICDAKVKDSKPEDIKDLYNEGLYVEDIHDILDRIYPEYKNTESLDEVPDRIWNKVYDILGDRLLRNYKENPNDVLTKAIELFNLKDAKIKDTNKNFEFEYRDNYNNKETFQSLKSLKKHIKDFTEFAKSEDMDYSWSVEVWSSNGNAYFDSNENSIKDIENFINSNTNVKDAKLTRKQKLWYGEELEKFIHPQYLRRNYQLKRIKRRKTK